MWSWLETSTDSAEQLDGCGRSSVQLVFSFLLSDARRKEGKFILPAYMRLMASLRYWVMMHLAGVSSPEPVQPEHVLVVQDGRGAKEVDAFAKRQLKQ